MSFITQFPVTFGDDGKAKTTEDARRQFDLFTHVRPFTLVREPEYGIDARLLIQNPINNFEDLLSIYLITLREKIAQYFQNITITRAVAQFEKEERRIVVTVHTEEEGEENTFTFSVKTDR